MLDIHAHYVSPSLLSAAQEGGVPVSYDAERNALEFPSGPSRSIPRSLTDLDRRRDWARERSIDVQIVSPWMDITGDDLEGRAADVWCRMSNDLVAQDLGDDPSFRAFASLPVSSGPLAANELERSVTELGFVGGALPTQVDGVDLDTAGLEPLFEAAEALDVPLFVHPFRVMARPRMDVHFLANVCGNPFETTLAALRLFFAGVLDEWPGLKLVLSHTGGALSLLAGRASHASTHVPGMDRPVADSSEILSRFYYDAILHDPQALAFAIRSIGASHLAAGTDFPFPMRLDDPVNQVRTACSLAGLAGEVDDQILVATARELIPALALSGGGNQALG